MCAHLPRASCGAGSEVPNRELCLAEFREGIFRPGSMRWCALAAPAWKSSKKNKEFHRAAAEITNGTIDRSATRTEKLVQLLLRHHSASFFGNLNLSQFASAGLIRGLIQEREQSANTLHAGRSGSRKGTNRRVHPQLSCPRCSVRHALAEHAAAAANRSIFTSHDSSAVGCVNMLRIVLEVRGERTELTAGR